MFQLSKEKYIVIVGQSVFTIMRTILLTDFVYYTHHVKICWRFTCIIFSKAKVHPYPGAAFFWWWWWFYNSSSWDISSGILHNRCKPVQLSALYACASLWPEVCFRYTVFAWVRQKKKNMQHGVFLNFLTSLKTIINYLINIIKINYILNSLFYIYLIKHCLFVV